jgi:hypothetical protein
LLRKTRDEFLDAAATDAFSEATGITAKTSPTLGGTLYTAAKAGASFAVAPKDAKRHSLPADSANAKLLTAAHAPPSPRSTAHALTPASEYPGGLASNGSLLAQKRGK